MGMTEALFSRFLQEPRLKKYKDLYIMAELSRFLGELVSSISYARVQSDIQSVKIAEEYAKNNLLQHFAVPRMRVDKVELNIPVAIDKLLEKENPVYEPIDNIKFSSIAYRKILDILQVKELGILVSRPLRRAIAENIKILEAKIRANKIDNALGDFSKNIASKAVNLTGNDDPTLLEDIIKGLNYSLKDEMKLKSDNPMLDSLYVVVEADKLREIKPENIIMIKMTVSEQGMEWVKMENINKEVITKLMPE